MPDIRDRVVDFRRVRAGDLLADQRNWREHPKHQRKALETVLEQVGFAGAVLARDDGGVLVLVDGHLRTDIDPDFEIPVLVLDVDEEEAAVLLATIDPISAMAAGNGDLLHDLVEEIDTNDAALSALLDTIMSLNPAKDEDTGEGGEVKPAAEKPEKEKGTSEYVLVTFRMARSEYDEKMDLLAECVAVLGVTPHVTDADS